MLMITDNAFVDCRGVMKEKTHFIDKRHCQLFGVRLLSGIFWKKMPKRMWLCAGISPVRYALQTW